MNGLLVNENGAFVFFLRLKQLGQINFHGILDWIRAPLETYSFFEKKKKLIQLYSLEFAFLGNYWKSVVGYFRGGYDAFFFPLE
jgi:hypothetical protein